MSDRDPTPPATTRAARGLRADAPQEHPSQAPIVRLAAERGVRVRTDGELAETLHALEVNREIPYAAFVTVADLLTCLYEANADLAEAARAEAPHPGAPQTETVGAEAEDEDEDREEDD